MSAATASRRKPYTISVRRLTKKKLDRGRALYPVTGPRRPKTRGECKDMERPCPYVSCRYHLLLDVHPRTGAIKFNHPDGLDGLCAMAETCALDVADRGGATLEDVGEFLGVCRERTRQIQVATIDKLRDVTPASARALLEEAPLPSNAYAKIRLLVPHPVNRTRS